VRIPIHISQTASRCLFSLTAMQSIASQKMHDPTSSPISNALKRRWIRGSIASGRIAPLRMSIGIRSMSTTAKSEIRNSTDIAFLPPRDWITTSRSLKTCILLLTQNRSAKCCESEVHRRTTADSSFTTPELHPKEQRPLFGDPGTEMRLGPRSLLMNVPKWDRFPSPLRG